MSTAYPVHTIDSAPEQAKGALSTLAQNLGLVPNLAATMASSPALLNSFVAAFGNFHGSAFSAGEKQVLLLTNAVANRCAWAVAFHSSVALREGVDPADVERIRAGQLPAGSRLAALSALTRSLIEHRGHISAPALDEFVAASFTRAQVLDVVAGIGVSTMANYAGNITNPPLEEPFASQAWEAS